MLKLLADENFNNDIVRGLIRRRPDLDISCVQDVGLATTDDEAILHWAAEAGRLVVTHDASTMIGLAYARADAGQPMPGVIQVSPTVPIGRAIEDLLLLAEASLADEWAGQVVYVPLG